MAQPVSRAVIEVLLDRVGQGAGTISPHGQVTYANQRFASMLGVSRGQLIGKALVELAAEADRDKLSATLDSARDFAAQCRVSFARSNGEFQALLTFAPLGHGQLSCIVTKEEGSIPQR